MYNAALYFCSWEHCTDSIHKSSQTIYRYMLNSLKRPPLSRDSGVRGSRQRCVLTAVYGCLLIGSIFLMLRPFISRRYASERRRARHASAYVCSRNISYQEATGIWEITRMDLWGSLLSNTSKRLRHLLISKFISPKSSIASRSYAAYWLSTSW